MSRRPNDNERGAVLLTTLLVMSLMATVAVEMLDDVRFGVRRTANMQAAAQADAYTLAAQDFARSYLEAQLKTVTPEQMSQYLKTRPQTVLPFEGGGMTLRLVDRGACISLGALGGSAGRRQFRRLLTALGIDIQSAANLTSVAADWIDTDSQALPGGAEDYVYLALDPPYRTANTAMQSITELRALQGFDEAIYQAVRPFVCPWPDGQASQINVNALGPDQAPVLAALLGDNTLPQARALLQNAGAPYTAQSFAAAPEVQGIDLNDADINALSYATNFIGIEARIVYQSVQRVVTMDFDITNGSPKLLMRRLGAESGYVFAPKRDEDAQ